MWHGWPNGREALHGRSTGDVMRHLLSIILALALPLPQGVGGKGGLGGKGGFGGNIPTGTIARTFNGSSDFLNSAATLDLTSYNKLSGMFWVSWVNFDNNNELLAEFSASFGGCTLNVGPNVCFDINPDAFDGKFDIDVHNSLGSMTCKFTRPSS